MVSRCEMRLCVACRSRTIFCQRWFLLVGWILEPGKKGRKKGGIVIYSHLFCLSVHETVKTQKFRVAQQRVELTFATSQGQAFGGIESGVALIGIQTSVPAY